jgi:hypothetical protein
MITLGNVVFGLGALIALVVGIIALVLWIDDHAITQTTFYGLIIGLAVARIVP